ncbi:hypothetical protein ZHAS_00008525 [Anopheles sinensis]|uniref:Uncharacterized protein n=1 Tax=Anopheles sinensis TaxID=74873 RepID=A0A084VSN2_ANOSI|nr:hypothetical protein ZHAS_00008525 [Anopheles sinensis]
MMMMLLNGSGGGTLSSATYRLTTQSLSYAKAKGKRPICDIPLAEILAVERLNERSFKMQNIFQPRN